MPWYADEPRPAAAAVRPHALYGALDELTTAFADDVREADLVIVGSYVPDGVDGRRLGADTARGVTAFYDIDTPVTLAKLDARRPRVPVAGARSPRYDLYLSFTGGPTLGGSSASSARRARGRSIARSTRSCYYRRAAPSGAGTSATSAPTATTASPALERLLLEPRAAVAARAVRRRRAAVPRRRSTWPANVERIEHLPPADHAPSTRRSASRSTSRAPTWCARAGRRACACSRRRPAACRSSATAGTGSSELLGREILIADDADDVVRFLHGGRAAPASARPRVLAHHTAAARAGAARAAGRRARRSRDVTTLQSRRRATARAEIRAAGAVVPQPAPARRHADRARPPAGRLPAFKWRELARALPGDLTGWTRARHRLQRRLLLLRARAARRAQVVGIDVDERYLAPGALGARRVSASTGASSSGSLEVYELARCARAVRPRPVHGRALPPAPPAARARPRRRDRRAGCWCSRR